MFVFKRNINDEATFGHFTGILVDSVEVDASNYSAETGSVVVTLPANYLATLAVGNHAIAATFDDGEASASFSIKTADSSGNSSASKDPPASSSLPKTGDPLRLIIPMLATMMIGGALLLALGVFALHGRRQGKHSRQ